MESRHQIDRRRFIRSAAMGVVTPFVGSPHWLSGFSTHLATGEAAPSPLAQYGAQVNAVDIADGNAIKTAALATCRILVGAGPLYWSIVHPSSDSYTFGDADRILDFGQKASLPVRGHTLVWHEMLPDWVTARGSRASAIRLLDEHIGTVVGHCRGRVHSWDVVNEPLHPQDGRADGLRRSAWFRWLGPDYIAHAFRAARKADNKALLGVNDFGLEGDSLNAQKRRRAMLALLRSLQDAGVPVDYLGVQAHLDGISTYSDSQLGEFLSQVNGMGIRVYVTELDVNDGVFEADIPRRDAAVADVYDRFLRVALKGNVVEFVLTWGLSDRNSWLQWHAPRADGLRQRPLPFDDRLQPKPAWDVLKSHLRIAGK
jgi:endo-1,4-beta-xylanase